MAGFKIGNRTVDALTCPKGESKVFRWDDALTGFGVVAYASGKKSYVIKYPMKGQAHRSRRYTLGEHGRLTPTQARELAKEMLGLVARGIDPMVQRQEERHKRPFKGVAEDFLSLQVAKKRKDRTHAQYRDLLDRFILPAFGNKPMSAIRRAEVSGLHARMSDKPATANRVLAVISSVWNWASDRDEIPQGTNPAVGVDRYKEQGRERYLSVEEMGRLGDVLRQAETNGLAWEITKPASKHLPKGNKLRLIDPFAIGAIRLLILTGARLNEILTAKWEWVDWDRGLLLLPDSKTGRKTLYLGPPALAVLKALPRMDGNPYIVPGLGSRKKAKGKKSPPPAPRHDLKKPWAAITKAAKLEGVRIHDLRHTHAAFGAGAGLGLHVIGKLLGHSQAATTQRYAHLDNDPLHRAQAIISGQLEAAMKGRAAEIVPLHKTKAS